MCYQQVICERAKRIADAGISSLWLPPPSDAVSAQGYLPRDLYNLHSKYGTETELRECLKVLHDNSIKTVADIVLNHRCAHSQVRWLLAIARLVSPDCGCLQRRRVQFVCASGRGLVESSRSATWLEYCSHQILANVLLVGFPYPGGAASLHMRSNIWSIPYAVMHSFLPLSPIKELLCS